MWADANTEAAKARTALSARLDLLRENQTRAEAAADRDALVAALSDASTQTRRQLLTTENALSERLYALALTSLHQLRSDGYAEMFGKMARELPALAWKAVRVNPADASLALKYFPDAEIVPLDTIVGGMDVMTEGGTIRVINTFEKRLERVWTDMAPVLIKEVYDALEHKP